MNFLSRLAACAAPALFLVFHATSALADETPQAVPRFGARGQVLLSDNLQLDGYFGSYSKSGATSSSIDVRPEAAVFVVDHVFLGAAFGARRTSSEGFTSSGALQDSTTTTFRGVAVVGGDIPLGRYVSISPRLRLSYFVDTYSFAGATAADRALIGSSTYHDDGFGIELFVPILLHPVPHFFVGVGPVAYTDLTRGSSDNSGADGNLWHSFGWASSIGGWF